MRSIVIVLLVGLTLSAELFTLVKHQNPAAKCLDGTQAALYYQLGAQKDKFLIYFEGGGLCRGETLEGTVEDCYKRSKSNLGSSATYPASRNFEAHGYLDSHKEANPFWDWTRVYIPYCDGSLHQGSRLEPIAYKDTKLYFRGSNNTEAHFSFLNTLGLFDASKIVISGSSAGGMASYIWSNYVYSHAKNPSAVMIIPDSGIFIGDFADPATNKTLQDYTKYLFAITNSQTTMPVAECVKKHPTQQQCLQAGNLAEFIKPPVFVVQSQYDAWGLSQVLHSRCVSGKAPASLAACNDSQRAHIQAYRAKLVEAVANYTKIERNGAWAVSCVQHVFLSNMLSMNSNSYRVPTNTGTTINEALSSFIRGEKRIFVDSGAWPSNIGCNAEKTAMNLMYE